MIHDRVSFGGVLVAISVLYLWLAQFPLGRRESWAWWALALSGLVGFLSFLAYLGYGYLDTWHGAATLVLLPMFLAGMVRARSLRRERVESFRLDLRSSGGVGRGLLLLCSVGISAAGLTIMLVGMTSVFVPQDLEFMGITREAVNAINPHLVPLIAHDRGGFRRCISKLRHRNVYMPAICSSVTSAVAGADDCGDCRIRHGNWRSSGNRLSQLQSPGASRFGLCGVRSGSRIGVT